MKSKPLIDFTKKNKILVFVVVFGLLGVIYLVLTRAAVPPVPSGYKEIFLDDFNTSSLNTSNWSVITGTEGHSQSYYTTNNVYIRNGDAVLRTRRHCVNATSDTLNDTNASTAACPAGKITVYSSGHIRTGYTLPKEGRIEIRAKLPVSQVGLWPALWTRNQASWCTANYGELDIMEWYSELPQVNTATSHYTCANNSTKKLQHNQNTGSDLSTNYQVWAMEWDLNKVTYYRNGQIVPHVNSQGDSNKNTVEYTDFSGLTQSQFQTIMDQLWQLRINTQVIEPGDAYHPAPDNSQTFQDVEFLIDYVRVMQKDTTTLPPTTTFQCPTWTYKRESGSVNIAEASGLIQSRNNPGIFWSHNDSGGTNEIWAIDSTGKVVSRHVLSGATAVDWEDISFGPGPDSSKDYIYVGDVGTKNRSAPQKIYRVQEPVVNTADANKQYTIASTQVDTFTLNFKLKNGSTKIPDIEGFAVDPMNNDIYFFDKELNTRNLNGVNGKSYVFHINGNAVIPGATLTANEVANVVGNVNSQSTNQYPPGGTAADISFDGQMLAMQNYDEVFIWPRNGSNSFIDSLNQPTDGKAPCYYTDANMTGATIPGSEAMTFSPDAKQLSFITEGLGSRIRTFENTNSTTPPPPPPPTKLGIVTGITATAGNGQVTLNWSAVQGADNYTVRWGTGGNWTNYSNDNGSNPTGTSYTVTGLTNGTTYNFAIAARSTNTTITGGDYSSSVTATPQGTTATKQCDFNADNKVSAADLAALLANYTRTVTPNTNGDCSGDGRVEIKDLAILLSLYGT